MSLNRLNSIARYGALAVGSTIAGYTVLKYEDGTERGKIIFQPDSSTPSRADHLQELAKGSLENPFDVLIIGGGATGTGCALDATTR